MCSLKWGLVPLRVCIIFRNLSIGCSLYKSAPVGSALLYKSAAEYIRRNIK